MVKEKTNLTKSTEAAIIAIELVLDEIEETNNLNNLLLKRIEYLLKKDVESHRKIRKLQDQLYYLQKKHGLPRSVKDSKGRARGKKKV